MCCVHSIWQAFLTISCYHHLVKVNPTERGNRGRGRASLAVMRHNETVLSSLEKGDLVEFPRGGYSHWAVYVGDQTVVHVTGINDEGVKQQTNVTHISSCGGQTYNKAVVRKDNFFKVAGKDKAKRNNILDNEKNPLSRNKIVENALSLLDVVGYNLLWKNCEHFATLCRYGEGISDQSDFLLNTGFIIIFVLSVVLGVVGGIVTGILGGFLCGLFCGIVGSVICIHGAFEFGVVGAAYFGKKIISKLRDTLYRFYQSKVVRS